MVTTPTTHTTPTSHTTPVARPGRTVPARTAPARRRAPAEAAPSPPVPGRAVPLAAWTAPTPPSLGPAPALSRWLARRLVSEYSRPGDLVADLDPDVAAPEVLLAAHESDRTAVGITDTARRAALTAASLRLALNPDGEVPIDALALPEVRHCAAIDATSARGQSTVQTSAMLADLSGRVALLVHGFAAATTNAGDGTPDRHGRSPAQEPGAFDGVLDAAGRLLRPGGVLVCLTRQPEPPRPFIDHPGTITAAAVGSGLLYLQHVIALTTTAESAAGPGGTHVDVCVFLRPPQP